MWIPSHVRLKGNKLVDERARQAAWYGAVFDRPLLPVDFQGLARSVLLRKWQAKLNAVDIGRFTHSILPKVYWFEGQGVNRYFVPQYQE
jgi:hypothetical protein